MLVPATVRNLQQNDRNAPTKTDKTHGVLNEIAAAGLTTPQVAIGYGTSQSRSDLAVDTTTQRGSTLAAAGDVTLQATGSGQAGADGAPLDGDIAVIGSAVTAGGTVTLDALRDITLQATHNYIGSARRELMVSHKHYWTERYRANAADWPSLVERPLFDAEGKWKYGGPMKLENEINSIMVLAMGDAPDELVQACIRRAKEVLYAIDSIDLLNTDARHARLDSSRISYLRGKVLLGLLEGNPPLPEVWHELGFLKLRLSEQLEKAPDERLRAVLYFLLSHEYAEAKKAMDSMRGAKGYEMEFGAMKKLVTDMYENGGQGTEQRSARSSAGLLRADACAGNGKEVR